MTLSDQTVEFLRQRLDRSSINTAVVIDNAFDPPTLSSLGEEVVDFWNLIERDDDLREQLESFGIPVESEDDISEEAIAALWSRRDESTPLVDGANRTLFADAIPALREVDRIVDSLQALGLEVDRFGKDYSDPPPVAGLVFMDYYLGDPSDSTSSELSALRAREIYKAPGRDEEKPFMILMSSVPEVSSHAERFREDSDLLGGLFDFVSKDDLNDPRRFTLRVATWTSNMPLRHKIQGFVEALDSTLCDRVGEFMKEAKSLTVEDYAFVQALSLQDDGHPLGDYVQWLFSSLLVNKVLEVNDSFTISKEEINTMSADSQPPSQLFPSTQLAEIYSIAIAEQGLGEIERHPRVNVEATKAGCDNSDESSSSGESDDSQDDLPMLRLGDLLVHSDGRRVYMVATPDCDLQFAPDAGRVPEEGESVMLVPGQLRPLRERIGRGQIQTELYFHGGEQCRIAWERKKVITVQVAKFLEWCAGEGYSRPARIRLPYAVKIQQEVIAGFSRVGMPVAPPLQDFVPTEIFSEAIDGTREPLGSPLEPGVNVIYPDQCGPKFVVTPAALDAILDRLQTLIARYRRFAQGELDENRQRQLTSKIDRLKRLLDEPEHLATMLEKRHDLPESQKATPLAGQTIGLHRNAGFPVRCRNNHVVCLNISYA